MKRYILPFCWGLATLAQAQTTAPVPSVAPSISAQPTSLAPDAVTQFVLPNGLTVIVKPDHRAPTAVNMLWVRTGAIDEVDGTSGVAHALEHMMFKGTKKLKPGEFSRQVAALGGQENAFTSRDYTGYYQQIPADKLEDVMRLEADRFANSQWPDEEFSKEIEVVKEERRMRTEDSPRALLFEALNAAVFTASPYHRPIVGWMGDLDSMTADDVRAFWKHWYVPANAAVVVAGDVTVAQVRKLVDKYYGHIPARAVPTRKPRPEPEQVGIRRIEVKAPAEQTYLALAFRTPQLSAQDLAGDASAMSAAGQDALALTVLSEVLDGYPGARINRALTQGEGRVADSAGAGGGLIGRGPQLFILDGVPAAGKTADQVEAALREQVAKVAREGVSEAELARVKVQWVASEVYKRDSVMGQAREFGNYWAQGFPVDASERLIERLRGVTAAQVQAVAARYFGDDQLTVAVLRPQPVPAGRKPRAAPTGARH
ncbi:M16 family metallopeptidase [Variovorax sp. HJSM1_2]|uniref:M16 family metallopeptidase n=1 Tax=Variovorax sp. HJSM1_2 TaxID=3366263 RepID=UPI003BD0BC3B